MRNNVMRDGAVYGIVTAVSGALLLFAAGSASAQDHMGMAELHGQSVVNTLGTDIRNSGIRSSTKRKGSAQTAPARWPAHIDNRSVASHVFTVDELNAMNNADSIRAGRMLSGRTIAIRGTVVRPPRANNAIRLVGANGQAFSVFAAFPGGNDMPRAGSQVTLRGNVDRLRRTTMNIRNPQVAARGRR